MSAARHSLQNSSNDLLMRQAFLRVKQRCKAGFVIHDAITAEIASLFVGDAFQCFFSLQNCDRVFEAFQILTKAALICALMKPRRELVCISFGQILIVSVLGEFLDRLRPEHPIQVLM